MLSLTTNPSVPETPPPSLPELTEALAHTGNDTLVILIIAAVLIVFGTVAVLVGKA